MNCRRSPRTRIEGKTMTDTNALIVREALRADATHIALGHPGHWRECPHQTCRDAQSYIPETLVVEEPLVDGPIFPSL